MLRTPRKLSLQLTPLLDLLLIVIFAQYMDVQQKETHIIEAATEAQTQLAQLRKEHDFLQSVYADSRQQAGQLQQAVDQLRQISEQQQSDIEQAVAQQEVMGRLLKSLFNIPQAELTRMLELSQDATAAGSPEQQRRLESEIQNLARSHSSYVIRHMLSYDEIRKRCDLWDVHVQDNGAILFRTESATFLFDATTEDEFVTRLFDHYKSLPETKGLVIILVSHGDARADIREAVHQGMPQVTEMMRRDTDGATRFDYALLGLQPNLWGETQ